MRSKKTTTKKIPTILKVRDTTFKFLFRGKNVSPIVAYVITGGVFVVGALLAISLIVFLNDQVSEQAIRQVRIEPESCIGWNNAQAATTIDAIESTGIDEFTPDESAFVTIAHPEDVIEETEQHITCSGFSLSHGNPETHVFDNAELVFSLGAIGADSASDVLALSYSIDGSKWNELDSRELTEEFSNKTNGGYIRFPLEDYISVENIEQLSVQLTLHARSQRGVTKLLFDGVGVDVQIQKKLAVPELPEDVVRAAKLDFEKNENPEISVKIQDRSFWSIFGKSPSVQSVKNVRLYDPGAEIALADFEVREERSGFDTVATYIVAKESFTKPGLYVAEFEIEKDGVTKVIQEDFLWGVIATNVRTSVDKPGGWTEIGVAVLEQDGTTQCNADVGAEVIFPNGHVEKFSTEDDSIIVNETCVDGSVTNEPDYLLRTQTLIQGEYGIKVWTSLPEGDFVHTDSFYIVDTPQYIITREEFPTRIYPPAKYPVSFSITPENDFSGEVIETVPHDFALFDISNEGAEVDTDIEGEKTIVWDVDWKAHQTYTLGYTFDAPDLAPEYYELGPLQIGAYQDYRTWQIASDALSGVYAMHSNVNSVEQTHMSAARNFVVTDSEKMYSFFVTSVGTLAYYTSSTGGLGWDTSTVAVETNTDVEKVSIWYDQWTPGNTGDLIHIAYLRSGTDTVYYRALDTSDDTYGASAVSVYSDSSTTRDSSTDSLSITVASDDDIYVASTSSAASATPVVYFSSNGGTSFSTTADEGLDSGQNDKLQLMPLPSGDVFLIRWDISADDIQSKEYEDGADSWGGSWTNVDTNAIDSATYTDTWGATINTSTDDIYLAYTDSAGTTGSDVRTATYNGSSWTNKTDVETNLNYVAHSGVAYDSTNDEIYVVYNSGISVNNFAPFYRVSDDAMSTWSSMRGSLIQVHPTQSYSIDDYRALHVNLVSDDFIGTWVFDDDDNDLWFGRVVDIGYDSGGLVFSNFNGFESGDSVDASTSFGTPTYSSSTKRSGEYALQVNPTSSTEYVDHTVAYNTTGAEYTTSFYQMSGQFAFNIGSTPSTETTIFATNYNSSTTRFEIKLDTSRHINIEGTGTVSGTYALATDTWYVIAFNVQGYPYDHAEVGIYSSDMATLHESLYETGSDDWSYFSDVRLGVSETAATATLYYDDLVLFANRYAAGPFPIIKANYAITHMGLNAAGSDTAWTGTYTDLDEIPTSTSDYVYESDPLDETSNFESASSAGIDGDVLGLRIMNNMWEPSSCSSNVRGVRTCLSTCNFGSFIELSSYTGLTTTEQEFVDFFNVQNVGLSFGESSLLTTSFLDTVQSGVGLDSSGCTVRNSATVAQVLHLPVVIPDVSGSLYSDEGSTKITASAKTITLTVNGSTTACGGGACTAETSSGDYTISNVTIGSAGDVITVYVDGETEDAVTVTRAASASADISGLDLYQNRLIVRQEDGGPTTNANLGQYDNDNDSDIPFTSNSNSLIVNSGTELHVWTGDTYDPGGTVTTNATGGTFHIDDSATAYLDTATSSIALNVLIDTSASLTVSASANVLGDVVGGISAVGDLTVTGGTLTIGNGSDEDLYVNGGTVTLSGGTVNIKDDLRIDAGSVTVTTTMDVDDYIDQDGGTLTFDTGASVTFGGRIQVTGASTEINLDGGTVTGDGTSGSGHVEFETGTVNLDGGTLYTGDDAVLDLCGESGTLNFLQTAGHIYARGILVYGTCTLNTGTPTGGVLHLGRGGTSTTTSYYDVETSAHSFYSIQIDEDSKFHDSTTQAMNLEGDFIINSGTFDGNDNTMNIKGDWTNNSGTSAFTGSTSTVNMIGGNPGSSEFNGSYDTTFYNLGIGDGTTSNTITVAGPDDPVISANLTVDSGDTLTINSGRTVFFDGVSGSFSFSGTINGNGRFDYGDTSLFPSTGTLGSTLTLRYDVTSGSTTAAARTYPGPVEFYTNDPSFAKTVYGFQGTTPIYQNTVDLISNSGQTLTVDFDNFAQTNLQFQDDITIGANTVFEAASETTTLSTLRFTDNGTFNHNNGWMDFQGYNCYIEGTSDTTFYDLAITSANSLLNVGTYGGTNNPVVVDQLALGSTTNFLVISASNTLTVDSGATFTFPNGSALDGEGIFVYQPSAAFPTTGAIGTGLTVRFDSTSNSQTMSARTYSHVQIYGNNTSNTVTAAAGSISVDNLDLEQVGSGQTEFDMDVNDPNLTIDEDWTLGSNTYTDGGSGTIDINGDVTKEASSVFWRNASGTVLFSGTSLQTIDATASGFSGSHALPGITITNNSGSDPQTDPSVKFLGTASVYGTYTITTANVKVQYDSTGSSEVLGYNWNSPDANKIYFRSTVAGTQFNLHNYGSGTINDVDVKDAYNSDIATVFNATDASNVNSGNNYRWNFGTTLVTGTVYSNLTGTGYNCSSNNLTINISVNGDATPDTGTCTAADGTFSISATQPTAADQHTVVYIDGVESVSAATTTLTEGQYVDISADLYIDYVTIDSQSGTTVTNTILDTFDGGDDGDIDYAVTSGNLTVFNSFGLNVLANYTPGGTVTTSPGSYNAGNVTSGGDGDLVIASSKTLNVGSNAVNIGGDFDNNGTYTTSGSQTTTFTGDITGFTIDRGSSLMRNITFNGSGGGWSSTSALDMTQGTTLTMTNGTLSGTQDINIGSQANGSNIICGGTCGTISMTGGTVYLYGAGNLSNNSDWQFNNLNLDHTTMNDYTTTASGSGKITITGTLTLDDSSFPTVYRHSLAAGSKTWEFTGAVATPFDNRGYVQGNTSTFNFRNTGTVTIANTSDELYDYYYHLQLQPVSSSSYSLEADDYWVKGNITISSNSNLNPSTSTVYLPNSSTIDGGGEKLYNVYTWDMGGVTLTISNSDLEISGTYTATQWDTISIDSSRTLTMSGPEMQIFSGNSVSGLGLLRFVDTSGGPGSSGTISVDVQFDASAANIDATTLDARTYSGDVEFYTGTALSRRSATMASGTYNFGGDISVVHAEDGCGSFCTGYMRLLGSTNNPTVNVTGNIDFTGGTDTSEYIYTGSGTWTASGNVDTLCDEWFGITGCFTVATGNTFIMNGASKTLTSPIVTGEHFYDLEFAGSTTLTGELYADNDVTISGSFTSSNRTLYIDNAFTNNGTFTHGSGTVYFDGTSGSITGTSSTAFNNLTIDTSSPGTVTQSTSDISVATTLTVQSSDELSISSGVEARLSSGGTLTLNGTISGAGTLDYQTSNVFPSTGTISSVLRMNPRANDQSMSGRTYGGDVYVQCTDSLAGSLRTVTVSTSAALTFSSDLILDDGTCANGIKLDAITNDPATTVVGNLSIATGTELSAPTSLELDGDYTQTGTGTYTNNSGTVTLAGTSQQTLSGDMTGTGNQFYNMIVTNAGASNPDIIFSNDADVTNNFAASTAGSQIQFAASGNYKLVNLTLNGQASGTRVELTSSTPDTAWNLTSDGSHSVSYANVKNSNACPSITDIDASNGTNYDNGGNTCWIFGTLAFSISDVDIHFGNLETGSSCYAQGSEPAGACAGSETVAHTIAAETNSSSGYTLTVFGTTLSSGGATISAIGGVSAAPNPGSEQFGLRITASGGSGTVTAPYNHATNYAYDGESTPDQVASSATSSTETTYSIRYLGNISTETEAGGYSSGLTYIMTPLF